MNRIASRTLRASAALLFVLPLVSGFTYQTQPPQLSVSVPAGGSVHAQGIWASTSVSVTCNPNGTSVFSFATLTQAQDGRTVQAFSSHTDTCTGAAITVPFELFANPRVLRNGSALLEVDVFVNDGPSKTVTRTITLAAGTDSIVNSESTRIGATGTILSRVPVITKRNASRLGSVRPPITTRLLRMYAPSLSPTYSTSLEPGACITSGRRSSRSSEIRLNRPSGIQATKSWTSWGRPLTTWPAPP